jgi:hypothetical protein
MSTLCLQRSVNMKCQTITCFAGFDAGYHYKLFDMKKMLMIIVVASTGLFACRKNQDEAKLRYFEVGLGSETGGWQDTAFIVATRNATLIAEIEAQLALPVKSRRIVNGALAPGDGGYNRNASHAFKWHFKEDDWQLADMSIEIYDGKPHNDLDLNYDYWMNTVKRFSPWSGYVKREVNR